MDIINPNIVLVISSILPMFISLLFLLSLLFSFLIVANILRNTFSKIFIYLSTKKFERAFFVNAQKQWLKNNLVQSYLQSEAYSLSFEVSLLLDDLNSTVSRSKLEIAGGYFFLLGLVYIGTNVLFSFALNRELVFDSTILSVCMCTGPWGRAFTSLERYKYLKTTKMFVSTKAAMLGKTAGTAYSKASVASASAGQLLGIVMVPVGWAFAVGNTHGTYYDYSSMKIFRGIIDGTHKPADLWGCISNPNLASLKEHEIPHVLSNEKFVCDQTNEIRRKNALKAHAEAKKSFFHTVLGYKVEEPSYIHVQRIEYVDDQGKLICQNKAMVDIANERVNNDLSASKNPGLISGKNFNPIIVEDKQPRSVVQDFLKVKKIGNPKM